VWKSNRMGWRDFSIFVRFDVGDGFKIRFWHDVWSGDQTSKADFPDFSIARCKKASQVDHVQFILKKISVEYQFFQITE
jgi:hypothetical protein